MKNKNQMQPNTIVINFDSSVLSFKKRVINAFRILLGKRVILLGQIDKREVKK